MSNVLTLAEAKRYLRITHTSDDTLIQGLMDAAEDFAEQVCGIKLTEASHTEHLDGGEISLWPSHGPVISITSVTDSETDTVEDGDNYHRCRDCGTDLYEPGQLQAAARRLPRYGREVAPRQSG